MHGLRTWLSTAISRCTVTSSSCDSSKSITLIATTLPVARSCPRYTSLRQCAHTYPYDPAPMRTSRAYRAAMPGENNTITWSLHGYVLPGCVGPTGRLRPQRACAACPEVLGAEPQVPRRLGRCTAGRCARRPPVPRLRRGAGAQQIAVAERGRQRLGRHGEHGRLTRRRDDAAVSIVRHRHRGIEHIVRHAAAVHARGHRRRPCRVRAPRCAGVLRRTGRGRRMPRI